jgi:hypothetical protein
VSHVRRYPDGGEDAIGTLDPITDDMTSQQRWEFEQAGRPPAKCAACDRRRKGLVPQQRPNEKGRLHWVYVCLDCEAS